jgi:hypothetical protein
MIEKHFYHILTLSVIIWAKLKDEQTAHHEMNILLNICTQA